MNIAFINRALGMRRGGGEIWDLEMAKALNSYGVDITIYTGRPVTKDTSKPIDVPVKKVTSPFLYDIAYSAPMGVGGAISDVDRQIFFTQVKRHLGESHDLIHINGYPEFLRLKNQVDRPITIKLNGPPHSLFYDYIHPTKSSYSWLSRAEEVIGTGVTTEIVRKETGVKATSINPGVDVERFTPNGSKKETSGPTILWVGRFVPAKNLPDLIEAFATVREEYHDAELWLVGEGGRQDKIKSYAETHQVRDVTTFWGYVPNEDLAPFYRASDVFALSSKTENHPISLMEAMSCGRPVVAPTIGWIPKMVEDGFDALLVPPEEPDSLAKALLRAIENEYKIGQRARQTAEENFSWDQRASALLQIFEQVVKRT
jgi:glycosyltransferase involved in cell wall biosynthesis